MTLNMTIELDKKQVLEILKAHLATMGFDTKEITIELREETVGYGPYESTQPAFKCVRAKVEPIKPTM